MVAVRLVVFFTLLICGSCPRGSAAVPVKLSGTLAAGGDVEPTFEISPDGSRVAYFADQDANDVTELYSIAIGGGSGSAKLNGVLTPGGDVFSSGLEFSPNGDRILYLADQDTDSVGELYIVPSGGGQSVKLNGPLVAGGDVNFASLQFNPDGSRVLYSADQLTNDQLEFFSVPSSGGPSVKLNGALVSGGFIDLSSARFSADGSYVTYLAAQETANVRELFRAPSGGGGSLKLSGPLVAGGDVSAVQYGVTEPRVGYLADQDINDVQELYSVTIAGGAPVKMNAAMTGGGVVHGIFSPDGSRMLYASNPGGEIITEIYSVPSNGGVPVKLNGPLVPAGDVSLAGLGFSPDSSKVAYLADQDSDEVRELYSVPAAGGTAIKLNGSLVLGGDVDSPQFSPNSAQVLYRSDQEVDELFELYSVPSTGGVPIKLNSPLVPGGDVISAAFTADGQFVVYLADQEVDETRELFVVPSAGGTSKKLNGSITLGGNVTHWQLSSDGRHAVYRADQEIDEMFELYSVELSSDRSSDFNGDSFIDAADYTVWRDGLGTNYTAADYGLWKAKFGTSATGSAGVALLNAAVPEPGGILLVGGAMAGLILRDRRRPQIE